MDKTALTLTAWGMDSVNGQRQDSVRTGDIKPEVDYLGWGTSRRLPGAGIGRGKSIANFWKRVLALSGAQRVQTESTSRDLGPV